MFRKKNCSNCNYKYDDALDSCPKCGQINQEQSKEFKRITMLNFGKQIALFLTGWLGINVIATIIQIIMLAINPDVFEKENIDLYLKASMTLNAGVYLILFAIFILILLKDFEKLFKGFKKWQPYVAGIICAITILSFDYIYGFSLAVSGVTVSDNNNQTAIASIEQTFPIISLIVFGFVGPICEELTYRVGLFSFSKRLSKWIAYPATIIIFTLIHFDFTATNMVNELLNIPYYAFAAFALTFTYDYFGFAASMTAHIINNVVAYLPFVSIVLRNIH